MTKLPYRRINRPMAVDMRAFRDEILDALNALGVKPGDDFLVAPGMPKAPDENARGQARSTDSATAKAAAVDVYPRSGSQRAKILQSIHAAGEKGLTAEQASIITGVHYRSATPRIGELKAGGWIRETGQTRPGSFGSEQAILVSTEKAAAAIEPAMERADD